MAGQSLNKDKTWTNIGLQLIYILDWTYSGQWFDLLKLWSRFTFWALGGEIFMWTDSGQTFYMDRHGIHLGSKSALVMDAKRENPLK